MNYNLISNVESCYIQLPALLYYSHLPAIIISLFFGTFVFFKSGRSLISKILLAISVSFSLWAICNLVAWTTYDSRVYSFFWSFFETLSVLFYFSVLYFMYVFFEGKDVAFKTKIPFLIIFSLVSIASATKYYLIGFDTVSCDAIMNIWFLYCIYAIKVVVFLLALVLLIAKYIKYREDKIKKTKIVFVGIGSILLLFSFLVTQYAGDLISSSYYNIEFYGLFAMAFFIAILAYLIVKYNAFNIKLLGTQALIFALIILIASQFSFIRNNTNKILTAITLVIAMVFGWILVRSVKKEVKQKEELEIANAEISERKEQLQRISDSLAISNEKLKQLDSAKTEFISMASHQLRTPVTGIKGYTSMLIEGGYGEVTPEQKGALKKAFESNERMSTLIEDLLNVSKIESGKLEYEFSKFKMEKICQEVVDTLFPKAKDHNLYLEYKAPKKALPELVIDGTKVREVISNLVDNAVKYTPKGGVTLSLELCTKNEANCLSAPHIRITVSDTGIGVPPEEMEYLFLKFSRGKDVHRLNATGTGLGLFVGKKMIEGNGGKIWIESEGKDKGSRFIVELPVVREEEDLEGKG